MSAEDFSLEDLDQTVESSSTLQAKDAEYLNETAATAVMSETADTFWWTVMLLIFMVAFLTYASVMVVRGWKQRQAYAEVGYRSRR